MAEEEKKDEKKDDKKEDKKSSGEATAEDAGADGEGGEAAPAKKSKKKIIIAAAALVLLLAAGGGGAYFMLGNKNHAEDDAPKEKPIFYTMPEMIINLSANTKSTSFLKATIILELPKMLDTVAVEGELPRVMDAFNTYVRELRPSDLAGSAGITRLREELLLRANKVLGPTVKVNDVLFKEIVVQ